MDKEPMNTTQEFEWCLVGNIIGAHLHGENDEVRTGTKYFREGAKVYCLLEYGGMGHERIRVIGLPRKSVRMIDIVMDTTLIKNMRVLKVYHPLLVEKIQTNYYIAKLEVADREIKLQEFADYFNAQPSREIESDSQYN